MQTGGGGRGAGPARPPPEAWRRRRQRRRGCRVRAPARLVLLVRRRARHPRPPPAPLPVPAASAPSSFASCTRRGSVVLELLARPSLTGSATSGIGVVWWRHAADPLAPDLTAYWSGGRTSSSMRRIRGSLRRRPSQILKTQTQLATTYADLLQPRLPHPWQQMQVVAMPTPIVLID